MKLLAGDKLVIATHNQGKLKELTSFLSPYGLLVEIASNMGLDDPEETEESFIGNALLKARYVAKKTNTIAFADDSGLVVPALGGKPGIHTARWAGPSRDYPLAMKKVHDLLEDKPRDAYFVTVLAIVWPDGQELIFEGKTLGTLAWPIRGDFSYGYDPMFIPEGDNRTYAEMTLQEKTMTSARGKAFMLFKKALLDA